MTISLAENCNLKKIKKECLSFRSRRIVGNMHFFTMTLALIQTNHKIAPNPFRINFEKLQNILGHKTGKLTENFSTHSVVLTVDYRNPIHHLILWILPLHVIYSIPSRADIYTKVTFNLSSPEQSLFSKVSLLSDDRNKLFWSVQMIQLIQVNQSL